MMKKTLLAILTMTCSLVQASSQHQLGTVTFQGSLQASFVSVSVSGIDISSRFRSTAVQLPIATEGSFSGQGSGPEKSFTMTLKNYGQPLQSVKINFTGTADPNYPEAFMNSASIGHAASDVAVLLVNASDGVVFVPNVLNQKDYYFNQSGYFDLDITTKMVQTGTASPLPGVVVASATVQLTYD